MLPRHQPQGRHREANAEDGAMVMHRHGVLNASGEISVASAPHVMVSACCAPSTSFFSELQLLNGL